MFGVPERRLRDCRDSSYFLRYAKNYTSQGGEDGILEHLFKLVGTNKDPYCVDIGAWDGQHLSNSYMLTHEKKWGGLLVEANSERHAVLSSLYKDRNDVRCLDCLVDIDGENSLLNLLRQNNVPKDLDFISIDVDGADYHLWQSIGDEYKARVVCIEFNPTIPNHIYYIQERDITIQEGSSLLALVELGRVFGYHVVVTTTFNAIFLRNDLLSLLPDGIFTYLPLPGSLHITTDTTTDTTTNTTTTSTTTDIVHKLPPTHNSIHRIVDLNSLHQCSMSSDLFQTYSGELKLCGIKKLLWHRIPINIQQIQVIKPKKDRIFPFAPPYHKIIHSLEIYTIKITTLLTSIILYNSNNTSATTATTSSTKYMNNIITELDINLFELLKECSIIYGVCINKTGAVSKGVHIEKRPLQYIAQEILLNIILMCIITMQYYNTTTSNGNDSLTIQIIEKLMQFLLISAGFSENIADNILENTNNKRKKSDMTSATLSEYKLWLERAIYINIYINNIYNNSYNRHSITTSTTTSSMDNNNLVESIGRLSSKLSAHSLVAVSSNLSWNQLLTKNTDELDGIISIYNTTSSNTVSSTTHTTNDNSDTPKTTTTNNDSTTATSTTTSAEVAAAAVKCCSTEEIDELLRGLYWLHNFQKHSTSSSGSSDVNKLQAKWKNKFHWYESSNTPTTTNTGSTTTTTTTTQESISNITVNNKFSSTSTTTSSTAGVIDGLAVLLKSCWSKDR